MGDASDAQDARAYPKMSRLRLSILGIPDALDAQDVGCTDTTSTAWGRPSDRPDLDCEGLTERITDLGSARPTEPTSTP